MSKAVIDSSKKVPSKFFHDKVRTLQKLISAKSFRKRFTRRNNNYEQT